MWRSYTLTVTITLQASETGPSYGAALGCAIGSVSATALGSAYGKGLFDTVDPLTATWLRYMGALVIVGLIRLTVATARKGAKTQRPPLTRRAVILTAAYCSCLVVMNVAYYLGLSHLSVGVATTLQYLGPLSVAVIGSRRPSDLLWVALAGGGVLLLGLGPSALPIPGLIACLTAASAWAGYIVLGAKVTTYWAGLDLVSLGCAGGAVVMFVPVLFPLDSTHPGVPLTTLLEPSIIGMALLVGLLSSAVPFQFDLVAWKRVRPATFSVLQSLSPAAGALAGLVILDEQLNPIDWLAIATVVVASIGATRDK